MERDRILVHKGEVPKSPDSLRFVCISDTHQRLAVLGHGFKLPEGDVLLHCGDFSMDGSPEDIRGFINSLTQWRFKHKLVIAGNHELTFDPEYCRKAVARGKKVYYQEGLKRELTKYCTYLEDSGVVLYGYKIWGTPWVPKHTRTAFSIEDGSEKLRAKRDLIPMETDILMSHGPAYEYGDLNADNRNGGCVLLYEAVQRVRPLLLVSGHIHESHGVYQSPVCPCVNASICNRKYMPIQCPYVFDLPLNRT